MNLEPEQPEKIAQTVDPAEPAESEHALEPVDPEPPVDPEQSEIPSQYEWVAIPVTNVDRTGDTILSERRAHLWSLVLEARYIASRVERDELGWHLLVLKPRFDAACNELFRFVEENRNWPPFLPPMRPMIENTLPTLSVLILLATFHNLTGLDLTIMGRHPVDWIEIGNAHGSQILHGQWWRLATALTLHADWLHLFSNLAIGGFFVIYLCRDLGSGLAWSLLLTSGMLGNLANAQVQLPSHSSVGSSTAVFGAVGILGAISMVRYRHHLRRRWPLPVAAALSLLALLGTEGKQTDLGAHLFGFLFGFGLGLVTEFLVGSFGRPGRRFNALLALSSTFVVLFAWWSAIRCAD